MILMLLFVSIQLWQVGVERGRKENIGRGKKKAKSAVFCFFWQNTYPLLSFLCTLYSMMCLYSTSGIPAIQLNKMCKRLGRHIPFYTVVTDLGTAHNTWFRRKHCDKIYVASDRINKIARNRGKFAEEKIVLTGLPIRQAFADEEAKLKDRTTEAGKAYQAKVREELSIDTNRKMVLVMGGGEGVGGLSTIVDELYTSFVKQGVDATIYVVCGRNEKLKKDLETRDWAKVVLGEHKAKRRNPIARLFRRHRNKRLEQALEKAAEEADTPHKAGNVDVVGLGFVTKMAEYMVAADVLVSKAGPGMRSIFFINTPKRLAA